MISAITFDFWDTLAKDNSDELKRAAQGLAGKTETRLQLLTAEITRYHPQIKPEQIQAAFDHTNRRFRHAWKVEHYTPTVASRLQKAYLFLKIDLTPGFCEVVQHIETMEVKIPPDFIPHLDGLLAGLAKHYKLGIISDTIHTPGRGLRKLLEHQGLLPYFQHCIFSDEAGASKPSPLVFEQAATGLGVPLSQIVHIGDRESNDIAGPLAMGMKAILYTGLVDRDSQSTQASAVCQDYAQLPGIIAKLNFIT